jgi:quinol-cytochrome oxidoreductase complex cytochrome b subunit
MNEPTGGDPTHEHDAPSWWRTRTGLVFLGFVAIAAFFLITEHRAHLVLAIRYLPWFLLLACLLMVLVMVGGTAAMEDRSERKDRP